MPKNARKGAGKPATKFPTLVVEEKPKKTSEAVTESSSEASAESRVPRDRAARYAVAADTTAAVVIAEFSKTVFGDVFPEVVGQLEDQALAVHRGDLRDAEALLMGQAVGLNAMYTELVRIGRGNLGSHFDVAERLIRLGLKAQGQCRATLETLAAIKNPPTVFARQANIAAGPQQVNNTVSLAAGDAQSLARAGNLESEQNKLLEAHGERLDLGAADAAGASDQALAPVGAVHRPANE
jgi:hypothetical protein